MLDKTRQLVEDCWFNWFVYSYGLEKTSMDSHKAAIACNAWNLWYIVTIAAFLLGFHMHLKIDRLPPCNSYMYNIDQTWMLGMFVCRASLPLSMDMLYGLNFTEAKASVFLHHCYNFAWSHLFVVSRWLGVDTLW